MRTAEIFANYELFGDMTTDAWEQDVRDKAIAAGQVESFEIVEVHDAGDLRIVRFKATVKLNTDELIEETFKQATDLLNDVVNDTDVTIEDITLL